eukprot:TRINITY_DN1849_c0_g1_i2.p1 TRINITY_DN1849_c0_g1~~TRINITY_DN1849_c0_g1_i2.p1  ORF type:complete len:722 (+),score=125.62 TRINITY_DN1849_c0_g1_i2:161-2326(+)
MSLSTIEKNESIIIKISSIRYHDGRKKKSFENSPSKISSCAHGSSEEFVTSNLFDPPDEFRQEVPTSMSIERSTKTACVAIETPKYRIIKDDPDFVSFGSEPSRKYWENYKAGYLVSQDIKTATPKKRKQTGCTQHIQDLEGYLFGSDDNDRASPRKKQNTIDSPKSGPSILQHVTSPSSCDHCGKSGGQEFHACVFCHQAFHPRCQELFPVEEGFVCQSCLLITSDICEVCWKGGDDELMLLCDRCNGGYHTFCLSPKVQAVPKEEWFCPECTKLPSAAPLPVKTCDHRANNSPKLPTISNQTVKSKDLRKILNSAKESIAYSELKRLGDGCVQCHVDDHGGFIPMDLKSSRSSREDSYVDFKLHDELILGTPYKQLGKEPLLANHFESLLFVINKLIDKNIDNPTYRPSSALPPLSRSWIFQANPKFYDIKQSILELKDMTWFVNQHKSSIKEGDRIYIWECGKNAGLIAIATATSDPSIMEESPEMAKYQIDIKSFDCKKTRCRLHIDLVLKEKINRPTFVNNPRLNKMAILRVSNSTNFKLTVQEDAEIKKLIKSSCSQLQSDSPSDCGLDDGDDGRMASGEVGCSVCQKGSDSSFVVCMNCGYGCHTKCLSRPLDDIPRKKWLCQSCIFTQPQVRNCRMNLSAQELRLECLRLLKFKFDMLCSQRSNEISPLKDASPRKGVNEITKEIVGVREVLVKAASKAFVSFFKNMEPENCK